MVDKLDELLRRQVRRNEGDVHGQPQPAQPAQPPQQPPQPQAASTTALQSILASARQAAQDPAAARSHGQLPPAPRDIEGTGLSPTYIADLILKHLYFETELKSIDIADRIGLPFGQVTEPILSALKADRSVEIRGGESTMSFSWRYVLTSRGADRAKDALQRSFYVGKAPVSMYDYYTMVSAQAVQADVSVAQVREAYSDLIVTEDLLKKIGPAVSSNKSIFMYGPPGNGKTSIAERIFRVLGGAICVPHAIEIDGHVIKLYDPFYHLPIHQDEPQSMEAKDRTLSRFDCRWNLSRRPFVVVGGELTLETLDLIWNDSARYYEAPFQLKANGGILLIDDFGRQVIKPQDLLNRWIVPLEKGVDYLTLHTGKKFEVPFRQLVVFSTNLNPADLVDEAFLRRLRYKIEIPNPTPEQYITIFQAVCEHKGIAYDEEVLAYLMNKYDRLGVDPRSCHPRDLLDIILDESRFHGIAARLSPENIDLAWASYFVTYKS